MHDVFSLPPSRFPQGFLWGSATAGHQIEGDNRHSQLWAMERGEMPAPSWQRYLAPSGMACDSWNRWREDVALIADLGHQAYRFSIEWSRIEPVEGRRDEAALARYVEQLEALVARGIQPWVTLHHFSHPRWFEACGGFNLDGNEAWFQRHVEWLVPRIAHLVQGWLVFNEFNLGRSPEEGPRKRRFIQAHARAYHFIKTHSSAPVSSAHAHVHWVPRRIHDPLDQAMTAWIRFATHDFWFHAIRTGELVYPGMDAVTLPEVKGTCDWWAVNYYTRHLVDARSASHEGPRYHHAKLRLIDQDFYLEEFFPEGLIANLESIADKPVIISENGLACDDDRWRIVYLAQHLTALREAMDRGVDVRGYLYWSLLDNYEWNSFKPRFGLVEVDFATFARKPRPSAAFLREVIRENGLTPEITARHLAELPVQHRRPTG